jgi:murein tripeptide amidase MpaA
LIPILAEIEPSNYEVLQYFNSSNIRYEIVTKDLQEFIENQRFLTNSQLKNKFDYDYTYHRYNQIVKELRDFETKYSNLTQIVRIGKSTEGRKIFAIILNNKSNKISKKNVIIECGIHAREWISIATCLWISNQLVSNNTDRILLDRYEFIIIPSLNPDGYEYTWTTNRLWRKTRSKSKKSECIGTDLNRK